MILSIKISKESESISLTQAIRDTEKEIAKETVKEGRTFSKIRLHLIDELRGFWLINMIIYHAIWDLVNIFHCNWQWYKSDIAFYWQQSICWSFIFISGFCWKMSRKNLKRGLLVFGGGLVITLATLLFMPGSRVIFGVLTLIGSSMLLMIPCDKVLRKVNPLVGVIISFLIFLLVYPVNDGYLGIAGQKWLMLPRELYTSMFTTYLGFPMPGFWSTDYFSIIPWFFLYMTGYFMHGVVLGERKECKVLTTSICPPLGFIGKHALIIYMLHQPVVYGMLTLWHMINK